MNPNAFIALIFSFSLIVAVSSSLAQENLVAIVKKIQPSVVSIITHDDEGNTLSRGSGFFINKNGDVITNRHVLEGAFTAEIKTAEGKVYPVTKILAEDIEGDLVQLSVDINPGTAVPLSISLYLPETGERIIVIGSPLGLEKTVSEGIVSAVREIPEFGNIIQITAPISPGSSGSAVVNMRGEVIGVATLQIVEGQNLNFAIPGERIGRLKPDKGKDIAEWQAGLTDEWLETAEGLYSTGLLYLWIEDYENALNYFEKAVIKNPKHDNSYFLIGYCNGKLGRSNEAIEAFRQATRINPDFAEGYYNLGVTYGKLGRWQEAIEAHKQAVRIKPDFAEAHFNLGVAYTKLGRWKEAIEAYKQGIRIKPDVVEAHILLGGAYGELDSWQEAMEAFKQAIRISPDHAGVHFSLAWSYVQLGRWENVIEECKEVIRIKPDYTQAYLILCVAYDMLGRWQEEIEAYKHLIRARPDYGEAHFGLGLVYAKLHRTQEAIEAYKQALRIEPHHVDAHFNLGLAYLVLGDKGSALQQYKILKELDNGRANELFNLIYE